MGSPLQSHVTLSGQSSFSLDAYRPPAIPPLPGSAPAQASPWNSASGTSAGSAAPMFFVGGATPQGNMDHSYSFGMPASPHVQQQHQQYSFGMPPSPQQMPPWPAFTCTGTVPAPP